MGLKGSLRNTSSVLPAFFDVTITNTNSPVKEGDILTVDYSADNTGDAQDMQDIRLEIDSVQEDVDPDVILAGGASTTGTLEWDTTGEPEAEYTATVLSDDDSDSVIVEIEPAIPDSGLDQLTHRWVIQEDDSSSVADVIGNEPLSFVGSPSLINDGNSVEDHHMDVGSGEQLFISPEDINDPEDSGTIFFSTVSVGSTNEARLINTFEDRTISVERFYIRVDGSSTLRWGLDQSTETWSSGNFSTNARTSFAMRWDDGSADIFVGDENGLDKEVEDISYNGAITLADDGLSIMSDGSRGQDPADGEVDDIQLSTAFESDSNIQQTHDNLPWTN